jgi:hypothetical protein
VPRPPAPADVLGDQNLGQRNITSARERACEPFHKWAVLNLRQSCFFNGHRGRRIDSDAPDCDAGGFIPDLSPGSAEWRPPPRFHRTTNKRLL